MKSRACCCLPPESCENKKPVERENIMLGKSLPIFLRMRTTLIQPSFSSPTQSSVIRISERRNTVTRGGEPGHNLSPTGWIILSVSLVGIIYIFSARKLIRRK